MDTLIKGLCLAKEIRFVFADVTSTAETLRQRHGLGPTAARVLGEALAACALLSADSDRDGESVQMQFQCDGPIKGFHVEVTGAGAMRGYTRTTQLPDLDAQEAPSSAAVLGSSGALSVVASTPGNVLYSGQVSATPPEIRGALARYYNRSIQIPSGVAVASAAGTAGVVRAAALVAQKMPAGDTEAFVQVLEAFHEDRVRQMLLARTSGDPIWGVFGLEGVETVESRALRFQCRCSTEAVINSLTSLETDEIRDIIDTAGQQEVTCRMCGEEYVVPGEVLLQILIDRSRSAGT